MTKKELEFKRILTNNEIKILDALKKNNHKDGDLYFHRIRGTNFYGLIITMEREKEYLEYINNKEYGDMIDILRKIVDFSKKNINIAQLKKDIEKIELDKINDERTENNLLAYRAVGIIRSIKIKLDKNNESEEEQEKKILEYVKSLKTPHYYGFGFKPFCDMENAKIEHTTRGLQGIVSIISGRRYYKDIFIPRHVYEKAIIPALNNQNNTLSITIDNGLLIETLRFIYGKTKELRKKYGNDFRPEFTRPEILKEVGLKKSKLHEFRILMQPLEGILGRVERYNGFIDEKWKSKNGRKGWYVSYRLPSWFLSNQHQTILEEKL